MKSLSRSAAALALSLGAAGALPAQYSPSPSLLPIPATAPATYGYGYAGYPAATSTAAPAAVSHPGAVRPAATSMSGSMPTNAPANMAATAPVGTGPAAAPHRSYYGGPAYSSDVGHPPAVPYSTPVAPYAPGAGPTQVLPSEGGMAPSSSGDVYVGGASCSGMGDYGTGYGYGDGYGPSWASGWFGRVGGLVMNRDQENHYFFSYYDNNEALQLNNTREAAMDWSGGVEARLGKLFDCQMSGIEFVYWGIYPSTQEINRYWQVGSNLNAILNFDQLDINTGLGGIVSADNLTNASERHRVTREFEITNLELNFIRFPFGPACGGGAYYGDGCGMAGGCNSGSCGHGGCGPGGCGMGGCGGGACGSRFSGSFLAGVRFFRFAEDLQFASDPTDQTFDGNDDDELYYDIQVANNLIGFQIGGDGQYCLGGNFWLTGGLRAGIYGNHVKHYQKIGNPWATAYINNGPNAGMQYLVENTKNDVAFLGELNFGLRYQWHCLSASLGYRALGVAGVALPTNQIYPDLRGIQDAQLVDTNGHLILHGAYAALEFCF